MIHHVYHDVMIHPQHFKVSSQQLCVQTRLQLRVSACMLMSAARLLCLPDQETCSWISKHDAISGWAGPPLVTFDRTLFLRPVRLQLKTHCTLDCALSSVS